VTLLPELEVFAEEAIASGRRRWSARFVACGRKRGISTPPQILRFLHATLVLPPLLADLRYPAETPEG
jgi:hypothetical protein